MYNTPHRLVSRFALLIVIGSFSVQVDMSCCPLNSLSPCSLPQTFRGLPSLFNRDPHVVADPNSLTLSHPNFALDLSYSLMYLVLSYFSRSSSSKMIVPVHVRRHSSSQAVPRTTISPALSTAIATPSDRAKHQSSIVKAPSPIPEVKISA